MRSREGLNPEYYHAPQEKNPEAKLKNVIDWIKHWAENEAQEVPEAK